jgi:tetratricopeptide (TPR) repeat protein
MNEERDNFSDEDIIGAVNKFKSSLVSGRKKYFDVSEFEGIVEQLMDEGDIQASEIAAKQGIQIHPNAIPLQLKYAQILISKGKYDQAHKYLNFAEKVETANPDVHLLKGSAWLIMGNEVDAKISFAKALKHADGEEDDILYHIGSAFVQVGDIQKAIQYFEKAIIYNPKNDMVLYDLAFFCDQTGKYKKSIKYYNLFIDNDPYNYTAWFNMGIVFNKANKHKKAIEAYEYALAINEGFHMALFNIGNALANSSKFEKAIDKYREYLEVDPKNDDAYCYIGECYLNLEDNKNSEDNYLKALEINDDNDTAWFGIGLIMWIEQNYEKSINHIKKAIKIDDKNSEYWLTLGKVNTDYKNRNEALKAFKEGARIDSENTEIWLTWAEALKNYDELENAIRIIKLSIKNNDDSMLKYRLVAFLLEAKKAKEAHEWLRTAMKQDFENINYLFDIYPKSLKSKRLKKVVDDFREAEK